MNRLQKFIERGVYGTTRIAYVLQPRSLPPAAEGMDWYNVGSFNAADEVEKDEGPRKLYERGLETRVIGGSTI
jgi:hypothetical protein